MFFCYRAVYSISHLMSSAPKQGVSKQGVSAISGWSAGGTRTCPKTRVSFFSTTPNFSNLAGLAGWDGWLGVADAVLDTSRRLLPVFGGS